MKSNTTKRKKFTFFKKHKKVAVLLTCIILFISALAFINYSRYAIDIVRTYYLKSKKFYFNSNRLELAKTQPLFVGEDLTKALSDTTYEINPWIVNDDPFEISITMNSKLNNTTMMDVDLIYKVSCSVALDPEMNQSVEVPTCKIKENNQQTMERRIPGSNYETPAPQAEGEQVPVLEKNIDHFNVVITPPGGNQLKDNDKIIVKITAEAISPYHQKLDAIFELIVGQYGVTYEIDDEIGRRYLDFIVTNKKPDQMMIVELGIAQKDTLIFDQNNAILDTIKTYASEKTEYGYGVHKDDNGVVEKIIFKVDSKSSNLVRFYKTAANLRRNFTFKSNSYGDITQMGVLTLKYYTEEEYLAYLESLKPVEPEPPIETELPTETETPTETEIPNTTEEPTTDTSDPTPEPEPETPVTE